MTADRTQETPESSPPPRDSDDVPLLLPRGTPPPTERLILREMTLADLDFLADLLADPEVMRFYPKCYSRDEARAWLNRQTERYATNGHGLWLVIDKASGQPVGQVGLTLQQVEGKPRREIGYLIHRPFWRRGFAFEAAAATRDYAFRVLRLPRVISIVRPVNLPSQGVARKLGMRPEPRSVQYADLEHFVFVLENPDRSASA